MNEELRQRIESKEAVVGIIGLGYVGLPLAHAMGQAEPYYLSLITGIAGASDLAGNELTDALPQSELRISPSASTVVTGGRVTRFTQPDEELLHELDEVAYVRFVSVYRSFETIAEFERLLHEMEKRQRVNIEGQRTLFEAVGNGKKKRTVT